MSRTACDLYLFGPDEKEVFRHIIRKQAAFSNVEVLTYCLLENHFHLLIRVHPVDTLSDRELLRRYEAYYGREQIPQSSYSVEELEAILEEDGEEAEEARARILARMGDLSVFMRELKQRFSFFYNRRHENHGSIWSERFKSVLVEDAPESLTKVAAYIDLNPVRAGLAEDPGDYRWSGYAEAMGGSAEARKGLRALFAAGAPKGPARDFRESIRSYRLILFGEGAAQKVGPRGPKGRIPEEATRQVRENEGAVSLQELLRRRCRYFSDGLVLGSQAFVESQFRENRSFFGSKRRKGGHPLRGGNWGDFQAMRDLRKGIFP